MRIKLVQDFFPYLFDIYLQILENHCGHTFTFKQYSKKKMFSSDVSVIKQLGIVSRHFEYFFRSRRKWKSESHFSIWSAPVYFFNPNANFFKI